MKRNESHKIAITKRERANLLTQAHAVYTGFSVWCFHVIDGFPAETLRRVDVRPVQLSNAIEGPCHLGKLGAVEAQENFEKLGRVQIQSDATRRLRCHSASSLGASLCLGDHGCQVRLFGRICGRPSQTALDARLVGFGESPKLALWNVDDRRKQ